MVAVVNQRRPVFTVSESGGQIDSGGNVAVVNQRRPAFTAETQVYAGALLPFRVAVVNQRRPAFTVEDCPTSQ